MNWINWLLNKPQFAPQSLVIVPEIFGDEIFLVISAQKIPASRFRSVYLYRIKSVNNTAVFGVAFASQYIIEKHLRKLPRSGRS